MGEENGETLTTEERLNLQSQCERFIQAAGKNEVHTLCNTDD